MKQDTEKIVSEIAEKLYDELETGIIQYTSIEPQLGLDAKTEIRDAIRSAISRSEQMMLENFQFRGYNAYQLTCIIHEWKSLNRPEPPTEGGK